MASAKEGSRRLVPPCFAGSVSACLIHDDDSDVVSRGEVCGQPLEWRPAAIRYADGKSVRVDDVEVSILRKQFLAGVCGAVEHNGFSSPHKMTEDSELPHHAQN